MLSKEYLANPAMSQSRLKKILLGVEEFKYALDHPMEPTDAMALGTAVHTLVLEPHNSASLVKVPKIDGKTREGKIFNFLKQGNSLEFFRVSKAKKKNQEKGVFYEVSPEEYEFVLEMNTQFGHAFKDPDLHVLLDEEDYDKAHAMAAAVRENEDAAATLKTCISFEQSLTYTYAGVNLKCQLDGVGSDFVLDLKTTRINNVESDIKHEIIKQGYHFQAASYLIGANKRRYFIIFVRNEPPYAVFPIELSEEMLNAGAAKFDDAVELYKHCLASNPEFKPNNKLRII